MTKSDIDPATVLAELNRILSSDELQGATRLQSFLHYVVNEQVAGRGGQIRAKTIGQDVYGFLSNEGDDPLAAVRVDAGRLRRRLEVYYSNLDNRDGVRIHIDKGGYVPRFALHNVGEENAPSNGAGNALSKLKRPHGAVITGVACSLAVAAALWHSSINTADMVEANVDSGSDPAVRNALFDASPAKLQAKNLADDARELMFPALDRSRLNAALALFEQVITLDKQYYAGFAGAGQINAILATQSPIGPVRDELVKAARKYAEQAIFLAPDASGAQSSMAMVLFAERNCQQAAKYSQRATDLSHGDLYASNFQVIIALFCGEFDLAVQIAKPLIDTSELADRLVFRNVAASAEFHRGNYEQTIDLYSEAIKSGDPIGALTLAYLAAAHSKLGFEQEAGRNLDLLRNAWPDFPLEQFLQSIFVNPDDAQDILEGLVEAGWRANAS